MDFKLFFYIVGISDFYFTLPMTPIEIPKLTKDIR